MKKSIILINVFLIIFFLSCPLQKKVEVKAEGNSTEEYNRIYSIYSDIQADLYYITSIENQLFYLERLNEKDINNFEKDLRYATLQFNLKAEKYNDLIERYLKICNCSNNIPIPKKIELFEVER